MSSTVTTASRAEPRAQADPLASARALARMLDSAVRIPGTSISFGLDAVAGLIPGIGDIAGAVLSGYIVLLGIRLGAPTPVVARMLGNLAIDTAVGAVPLLGDVFDVGWRANLRNVAILERHLGVPAQPERRGRLRTWLGTAALVLVLALIVVASVYAVRALARWAF